MLNEDTFYMKVIAHNEIYNLLFWIFIFEAVKMVKNNVKVNIY